MANDAGPPHEPNLPDDNSRNGTPGDEGPTGDELFRGLRMLVRAVAPNTVLGESVEQFYEVLSGVIRRRAARCHISGPDLDDCVQDVWVAVLGELPRLQHNHNSNGLRAWFYRVVSNKAVDRIRAHTRHPTESLSDGPGPGHEPLDSHPDASAEFELEWTRDLVHVVLDRLRAEIPECQYKVLHMRFIEERAVPEVAVALDITSQQVWDRQHRAMKKFAVLFNLVAGREFDASVEL